MSQFPLRFKLSSPLRSRKLLIRSIFLKPVWVLLYFDRFVEPAVGMMFQCVSFN